MTASACPPIASPAHPHIQLFPPPLPPKRSDVITVLAGRRAGGGAAPESLSKARSGPSGGWVGEP